MKSSIYLGTLLALGSSACADPKKLARQCEAFYAETGDERYHGKTDCRKDVHAHDEEVHRREQETKKRVQAERVAKEVLAVKEPSPPPEVRARLFKAFAPHICADLRQSNSTATMSLTLLTYTDNEPLYSLHTVYPPGSADIQSSLYTLSGKQFCVDGGISGGDCIHHLSDRHSHGSVVETGTISELKTLLKCP